MIGGGGEIFPTAIIGHVGHSTQVVQVFHAKHGKMPLRVGVLARLRVAGAYLGTLAGAVLLSVR